LPETTWISCNGSAVFTPPAAVMPNSATAVGSEATARQESVAGSYSSTVATGASAAPVPAYPPTA
jgi:hypothetical protein